MDAKSKMAVNIYVVILILYVWHENHPFLQATIVNLYILKY